MLATAGKAGPSMILGYIFKTTIASLVKAANLKLLYIPAAFAFLWLAQYSLLITYFDDSSIAFIGSVSARLAGLALFVYAMYNAMFIGRGREIEIETTLCYALVRQDAGLCR